MEMPLYKMPSVRLIVRRAVDAGWMFLKRAGTMILASMILVWRCSTSPAVIFRPRSPRRKTE